MCTGRMRRHVKTWIKRAQDCFVAALLLLIAVPAGAQQRVDIALVKDGPQIQLVNVEAAFREELLALTKGEFDVRFHELTADWTKHSVSAALEQAYTDPRIEMVLVVGFAANQLAVSRQSFPKPTFLPLVFNPELLGAPVSKNQSGQINLNYLADRVPIHEDLASFQRVSAFKQAVILSDALIIEAIPKAIAMIRQQGPGIEFAFIGHDGSNHNLLDQLPGNTEAVLLGGLPRMPQAEFDALLSGLAKRRIASFSLIGNDEVRRGALAADSVQTDIRRLARRNALNMQAVLLGEAAANQPVYFDGKRQLTINMDTARKIGLAPRFDVLSEAVLINPEPEATGPEFDLMTVARAALEHNLDLGAERLAVQIGEQDVELARAGLLPRIGLGSSYLSRDDSAAVRSGALAERTADSAVTLSMPLYTESITSGYQQQALLQQAQVASLNVEQLDTVFRATTAYLDALRINTRLKIEQENLNLTIANLDLARDRVRVGSSSNADVYRWESNLAQARANLLATLAARQQALESLNQVLHRPLDASFRLAAARTRDPFTMPEEDFNELVSNSRRYRWFADYHIKQGLLQAPELNRIAAQMAAARRDVVARQRAFWLPDFSVQAQYTDNLNISGFGSGGPSDGASDWNVSVNASVPLYAGGARRASLVRAKLTLNRLEIQKNALSERIEQQIRANFHATQASYNNIELSRDGAEAAAKNLKLVSDAYRQGTVSIIDLLDAQNQGLQADLSANNAVHDFLGDVMRLQRSIGQFDFLLSQEQQAKTLEDVRRYIESRAAEFANKDTLP